MKNLLDKLKTENILAKLKSALQKEYDIDSFIKKLFNAIFRNTKSGCAKLNIILHKEIDLDYYVIKSLNAIRENAKLIYPKLKTALEKEYDIDSHVKEALKRLAVFFVSCFRLFNIPTRHVLRTAAVAVIKARNILICLSKFVVLKRIILRDAIKQRRNNKVKARLDQERENIAFLTEFLNSLKEEFGADISFSLVSVNNDEGSFEVIREN